MNRLFYSLALAQLIVIIMLLNSIFFGENSYQKKTQILGENNLQQEQNNELKKQNDISEYDSLKPFKFLYVSDFWPYKNHIKLLKGILNASKFNFPIEIHFVGEKFSKVTNQIEEMLNESKYNSTKIYLHGKKNKCDLINFYKYELKKFPYPRSKENILSQSRFIGSFVGFKNAERFEVIKILS